LAVTGNAAAVRMAIEMCFSDPQNESHLRRFDELFRPLVMAILVSLYRKDPAYVEDAYQSAFIKYIEIFRNGKRDGVVYDAYFVAIAKNSLVDELRRRAKQVPLDEVLTLPTFPRSSGLDEAEVGIAFFEALSKLDRRCQFLIESFYVNGMPQEELAKRLKIQTQSVPVLLSRCRENLRSRLKK
jgi:RNA polymerase sigma factor (sigma-70 family)